MRYSLAVLKVKDVGQWKAQFHSEPSRSARKSAGEKSWQLFHVAGDANAIALLNEWRDEAKAVEFLRSETLRGFQEAAGVIGQPQVFLFDAAEQGAL